MKSLFALACTALSCGVLAACGGSVIEDSSSGAGGAGNGTSGPGSTSTVGAGPTTGNGVGGGDVVTVGSSGEGGFSGVGGSGAGGDTTSAGGAPGSGGAPGAGGAPPGSGGSSGEGGGGDPPIACGMVECDAATEVCCATFNGASCIDADEDCQGAAISCSSAAQCEEGEVCCGTFGGGNGQASCTSEPCGGGGPGSGVQLCETAEECPPDVPCEPAPGGIGISFCNPGFGGP